MEDKKELDFEDLEKEIENLTVGEIDNRQIDFEERFNFLNQNKPKKRMVTDFETTIERGSLMQKIQKFNKTTQEQPLFPKAQPTAKKGVIKKIYKHTIHKQKYLESPTTPSPKIIVIKKRNSNTLNFPLKLKVPPPPPVDQQEDRETAQSARSPSSPKSPSKNRSPSTSRNSISSQPKLVATKKTFFKTATKSPGLEHTISPRGRTHRIDTKLPILSITKEESLKQLLKIENNNNLNKIKFSDEIFKELGPPPFTGELPPAHLKPGIDEYKPISLNPKKMIKERSRSKSIGGEFVLSGSPGSSLLGSDVNFDDTLTEIRDESEGDDQTDRDDFSEEITDKPQKKIRSKKEKQLFQMERRRLKIEKRNIYINNLLEEVKEKNIFDLPDTPFNISFNDQTSNIPEEEPLIQGASIPKLIQRITYDKFPSKKKFFSSFFFFFQFLHFFIFLFFFSFSNFFYFFYFFF